jgi:hypothetical protein
LEPALVSNVASYTQEDSNTIFNRVFLAIDATNDNKASSEMKSLGARTQTARQIWKREVVRGDFVAVEPKS